MDVTGKIQIAERSDTGRRRSHNEDSVGHRTEQGVVVLADGMGGCRAGEIASAIAVNTLLDSLSDVSAEAQEKEGPDEPEYTDLQNACRDAVAESNRVIYQTAESQPQYKGMGTTVTSALFHDNHMVYAHVGDSRIYRFRDNTLEQLTTDHTLAQEFIDHGVPTDATGGPGKNFITRALGAEPLVEPSVAVTASQVGDLYLFCSDGLHDMIRDTEISLTLYNNRNDINRAAEKLIDLANDKGGPDNISVILASVVRPYPFKPVWYQKLANWL